jgi:penicillin-binding protein 2
VQTKRAAVVQLVPSKLPQAIRDQAEEYRKQLSAAETERLANQSRYEAFARQLRDDDRRNTKAENQQRAKLKAAGAEARAVAIPPVPASETDLIKLYARVGKVLKIKPETIHERVIRGIADTPFANITIRTDVPPAQFNYMRERPEDFPGVEVTNRYIRQYPKGRTAAQIFGTVSEITDEQRDMDEYEGIEQGTRIGQSGLEAEYDKYLRGVDGYSRVTVDAFGRRDEQRRATVTEPKQGQRLKLTLDYNLQKAGDEALQRAISASQYGAKAGAYVAMDLTDGSILAMGSQPSFNASVFARPFSQSTYRGLVSDKTGAPLLERATESQYPTGSVFKPFTAFAALDSGVLQTSQIIEDNGKYELGTLKAQNAKGVAFGSINLRKALTVSSDVFFYKLGEWTDAKGSVLQRWAKRFGFGRDTGIDLPGERPGLVPSAKWRNEGFDEYQKCVEREKVEFKSWAALIACGGIDRPWSAGDNVNLAVGQGDLQATPLQVAVAYAAIANNGTVVTPHLAKGVETGNGVPVQDLRFKPKRKLKLNPSDRQAILDGLRGAASEEGGTSADVFKGWPKRLPVYGKTGTVERPPNPDQSWYACFVKDSGRPIVVVVTVERGGFGAETAAPAARQILAEWFDVPDKGFHAGTDQSN